jgi:hypothetical protein
MEENTEMTENDLLEHAVLNQIEADLEGDEYDVISEMLQSLISKEESRNILIEYLSDSGKENWLEGRTNVRY